MEKEKDDNKNKINYETDVIICYFFLNKLN